MTIASNLGFPRIGRRRELKFALERYWAGGLDELGLLDLARDLRMRNWQLQKGHGISHIPSADFSLYDHVLDTACMVGAVPPGYGWSEGPVSLSSYFALARGVRGNREQPASGREGLAALEMTKWFDTNYHYLVPQLHSAQRFTLTENRPLAQFKEARGMTRRTRPVLLGPVSFLMLSKTSDGSDPLDLLGVILPCYARILAELAQEDVAWVQIDEPVLALDLPEKAKVAFGLAYGILRHGPSPEMLLASYYGPLGDNLPVVAQLPVSGLHVDLVRGADDLDPLLYSLPAGRWLSLGVIDGRNIWRSDLRSVLAVLQKVAAARGDRRLMVAPSCSLLHVPIDVHQETGIDPEVKRWLAFAEQKLDEVVILARGLDEGETAVAAHLQASDEALRLRQAHGRVHRTEIRTRVRDIAPGMERRSRPYPARRGLQQARFNLPAFPTTTIGSFPQTADVRKARVALSRGEIAADEYDGMLRQWIKQAVEWQEEIGIDVLVHGEFERNDMVKYFGERLEGFSFTQHGWVQSYGSRCVAPPIIWGDVFRPKPMTVRWSSYAQSCTKRPVKGMLTGPVTMLRWSFVRDDLPRAEVCRQLALAIRDEVADLEAAEIGIIQVDEPAFREGLPLRRADWAAYLSWAVACFRLATSSVRDDTSIHTHMCYSEFNDIMPAIAAMDADAISIETTRSRMELLDAFAGQQGKSLYPAEIGPGIWDIHSPRIPEIEEMVGLLKLARDRLADWQIWVNPDCGLKTRSWQEVRPALQNLVAAARVLRSSGTG